MLHAPNHENDTNHPIKQSYEKTGTNYIVHTAYGYRCSQRLDYIYIQKDEYWKHRFNLRITKPAYAAIQTGIDLCEMESWISCSATNNDPFGKQSNYQNRL
jgi:hypothetical protein